MMRRFSSLQWSGCLQVCRMAVLCSAMLGSIQLPAQAQEKERPVKYPTLYRAVQIDGLSIFYREAGPKDAPTLLLLHGLPSSSRMFEPLFARHADRYHLRSSHPRKASHRNGKATNFRVFQQTARRPASRISLIL